MIYCVYNNTSIKLYETNQKNSLILLSIVGLFFLGAQVTSAHQPYYIGQQNNISVQNPEISKAYYAELTGQPAEYTITSDTSFELYLNILVPDIAGVTKDFSAVVHGSKGNVITILDGEHFAWERWYEDFAGDWYWKGPEFKQTVPAGTYTITVSNPDNTGKYVLAPGEAEVFTIGGTPHTVQEIYEMKTKFFGKPWYSIFEGVIGKIMLGSIVFIISIIVVVCYFLHRRQL